MRSLAKVFDSLKSSNGKLDASFPFHRERGAHGSLAAEVDVAEADRADACVRVLAVLMSGGDAAGGLHGLGAVRRLPARVGGGGLRVSSGHDGGQRQRDDGDLQRLHLIFS
ncbi:hypothetical protein DM47_2259 [Burkholderia mallei]|nr:hypothetical protein X947_4804 [Burkholderia pseudomallei MSHR7334]KOS75941.1 hypothetical protein DM46_1860 [Burkholderia mallei]KOT16067.1 hypothetical protein DM47_2259 [Burkholderia mallei]